MSLQDMIHNCNGLMSETIRIRNEVRAEAKARHFDLVRAKVDQGDEVTGAITRYREQGNCTNKFLTEFTVLAVTKTGIVVKVTRKRRWYSRLFQYKDVPIGRSEDIKQLAFDEFCESDLNVRSEFEKFVYFSPMG